MSRTAHDSLLAECEPYFLDGAHTIALFAQHTQERVREAVEQRRNALVKALGVSDDELALGDYWYPDTLQKAKPTEGLHFGVKVKFSNVFAARIYRYWRVDNSTGVAVSTWVNQRTTLDRLTEKIDDLRKSDGPPGPVDSWGFVFWDDGTYYIVHDLKESEIGELDLRLDELISYYISLVTKVGGVKKFLSAEVPVERLP